MMTFIFMLHWILPVDYSPHTFSSVPSSLCCWFHLVRVISASVINSCSALTVVHDGFLADPTAMASLRSVIQREIIAVKHALANNTAHEGIVGDDLKDLLKDLQAYRAEVIARSKSESTKSMKTFSVLLKDCKRESDETAAPQSEPKRAKFSRVEIPRPGDSNTSKPPVSPEKTEAPPKKIKIASVPKSKSERGSSSTGGAGGAGGSRRKSSLPKKELQVQDSSKKSTRTNDLRQLRRDIQVGDIISVVKQAVRSNLDYQNRKNRIPLIDAIRIASCRHLV